MCRVASQGRRSLQVGTPANGFLKGDIAAMLAAGGSAGALCAWPTADYLGRKWSVLLWGMVFLVGAIMQMIANYDVLLTGRFIGGMGVGASSMLSPQFLAENSPKSVRGSMTATYNLMIILSLMLAFWVSSVILVREEIPRKLTFGCPR